MLTFIVPVITISEYRIPFSKGGKLITSDIMFFPHICRSTITVNSTMLESFAAGDELSNELQYYRESWMKN